MAAPSSVTVNPHSATDATSGANSGIGGGITFAFGGNPNLALLNTGAKANWLVWGALAIVAGLVLWKLR